jgi:hypothetical protein
VLPIVLMLALSVLPLSPALAENEVSAADEGRFQAAQATGCAGHVQIDTFGTVRKGTPFHGWAVDMNEAGQTAGVDQIEILRGGSVIARGSIGVARPDVDSYLRKSDLRSGWVIDVDWSTQPRGQQTYTVRARTACGWVESQVTLDVDPAPPVSLSINDQRGTVSGSDFGYGYYGYYGYSGYTSGMNYDTELVFTVSLSGSSTSAVSVNYATANGSAVAGVDYASTSGTLNFAAGETSKTITVRIYGDLPETRTFYVRLSNPVNATIADGEGAGTIEETYYGYSRGYRGSSRYFYGGAGYVTVGGGYYGYLGGLGYLGAYYRYNTARNFCAGGFFWNGYTCVATGGSGICPIGYFWNGFNCVVGSGGGSLLCPSGFVWNGLGCVSNSGGFVPGGSISISGASCLAGTPCTFTITQTGGSSAATVNYSTVDSAGAVGVGVCTAAPNGVQNYLAVNNGTVTVAPNGGTAQISIMTCLNAPSELAQGFFLVNMTSPSGLRIANQGQGVINPFFAPGPIDD